VSSRMLPIPAHRTHADYMRFFRSWLTNPLRVGAVAPSGRSLARLITSQISPETGPVLELGPGTGVFTRALLERGVALHDLTLVEYGPDFARLLEDRFPGVCVVCMDAARLSRHTLCNGSPLGAVVSGLPLISMPPRKVMMILSGSFWLMRPGASFFQFTYGLRCPVPRPVLDRLGLKATRMGITFHNIPPATAYRISRRRPLPITAIADSGSIYAFNIRADKRPREGA
jgi:phosphatidylethanolamine/phosphatidyl-N-methylethanolamine N-methyltransferase